MTYAIRICSLVLVMGIIGCAGDEGQQTSTGAAKVVTKKDVKPAYETLSSKLSNPKVIDFATLKKDPFYTTVGMVQAKAVGSTPKAAAKKLVSDKPILKHDFQRYKLIAIVIDSKTRSALYEDPEGKGWIVREGDRIGNEGAVVRKIAKDGVTFEESIVDDTGKSRVVEKFVPIKKVE